MKTYKILLYSDFFHEWEIVITNIPRNILEHYIFLYCSWYDLKIDFEKILELSGYKFKVLKYSGDDVSIYDIDNYSILENNKFFVNDFYYEQ